jgi:hypothetical protein
MATIIPLYTTTSVQKKKHRSIDVEQSISFENNNCAEIIIFPGIRIERISAEDRDEQENLDKLSKFECQL